MTSFFVYKSVALAINYVMLQENRDIEIQRYEAAGETHQQALYDADPAPYDAVYLFNPGDGFASFFVPGRDDFDYSPAAVSWESECWPAPSGEENKSHKLI
jgi:hypothetical protein